MKHLLVMVAFLVLAVSACSEGMQEPHEVVETMLQAAADGDNEQWEASYAPTAVVVFPDGSSIPMFGPFEPIQDDFDGDGVLTWADDSKFRNAMHAPTEQEMSWECSTVEEGVAECSVAATTIFVTAGGGDPLLSESRHTVEDGLIVREEFLGSPDPAAFETSLMARFDAFTAYEAWVLDTYPDRYRAMFRPPCCQASLVALPDAVSHHAELIDEYFTAAG